MIDIHCHLLPGIDDGAKDMNQALEIARAAYTNGIRYAVLTPHINPGRFDNTAWTITEGWQLFKQELVRAGIDLSVGMAAEVRLSPEILPMLEQEEIPYLGEVDGYKILLLEFPHSHIPPGADRLVEKLLSLKVRPIIAHPERNKDVIRNPDKITPFIEMGCFLQLTSGAVAGRFGDGAHERALELLESDAFKVIATDAHNLAGRYPELHDGFEAAAEILGVREARRLVFDNPMRIVHQQFVETGQPAAAAQLNMRGVCADAQRTPH